MVWFGLVWRLLSPLCLMIFYSVKYITCRYFDIGSYPTANSSLTCCVRTYETGIVGDDYFSWFKFEMKFYFLKVEKWVMCLPSGIILWEILIFWKWARQKERLRGGEKKKGIESSGMSLWGRKFSFFVEWERGRERHSSSSSQSLILCLSQHTYILYLSK